MVSLCVEKKLSLVSFFSLEQTPKIKMYHMVASENPEVIEGRRRFIAKFVLESEEAAEDGFINDCGAALGEEDDSSTGEVGVRTGVTK